MSATPLSVDTWLDRNRDRLAALVTDRQYARMPELAERYGPAGRAKCESDARYHLDYLGSAVVRRSPELFLDYVGWARALLANLGVDADDLRVNLSCLLETIAAEAPEGLDEAMRAPLELALDRLDSMPDTLPTLIDPASAHAGIARRYLDLMLGGQRHEAMQLVVDAAKGGVPVRDIYLEVFAPVQREIGRLWQHNQITVAEEHYCTAITQLVISQLYPYIFSADRKGRTLVATCVTGDLHEIGVRMVADFYEMDGWDTYYLGANVPFRSILSTVRDRSADVVAISATITRHVNEVGQLIEHLRADEVARSVRILVGGYPFNVDPELWRRLGADGHARDAEEAVALGNRLVEGDGA